MSDQALHNLVGIGLIVWIVLGFSGTLPVIGGLGCVIALVAGLMLLARHVRRVRSQP